MCELAHGEPPTPTHEAAHSCGRGHEGCVHPKHLSWKTQSGNQLDRREHGTTALNERGILGKLSQTQVESIRSLATSHTQDRLATMFNTSRSNIQFILAGKSRLKIYGLQRQRILMTLAKAKEPMTTNEIMESARLVSKYAARSMLQRLARTGIVLKISDGLYVAPPQSSP